MLSRSTGVHGALCLVLVLTGAPVHAAEPEGEPTPASEVASDEGAAPVGPEKAESRGSERGTSPIDRGRGAGERRVSGGSSAPDASANAAPTAAKVEAEPKPAPRRPAHQTGRAPQRPSPTLPAGVERPLPNAEARRNVSGGPTDEELLAGHDDPQLRALREAERVLFARPLQGIRPGWSWELPQRVDSGAPAVHASGIPPAGGAGAPEDTAAAGADWVRRLRMPDLAVRLEQRVVKYLEFYRDDPRGKQIARAWAKKSGRLVPALKAELARAGVPTDLVWLSLIESGHNPTIMSPAGAAGLWQFIPESGRMYGLTVDRWVDERLDPERATEAAIRYLKDLHARFGNWELAMAAYNMGHGGLLRAVRKFNTNDFWVLSRYEAGIPWETTLYVPKILAIAIVMNNPEAFGIDDIEPDPPISFDTVYVERGTTIAEVARAAQVPEATVREMNAHYLAGRTPPESSGARFRIRVPTGHGIATSAALAKAAPRSNKEVESVLVRYGDTLSTIARERGTTERALRQLNGIGNGEVLHAGAVLLVPARSDEAAAPANELPVAVVPARRFPYKGRRRLFYEILPGDTVDRVARAFSVSSSDLSAWNALDASASLQPGMMVQVYADPQSTLERVRFLREDEVRVVTAGSDEFFEYFEGLNGRRRITVTAREGETLASIGKRYGMSSGMMERINRFSRSKKLEGGERVIVYTKAAQGALEGAGVAEPLSEIVPPRPEALPSASRVSAASNGARAVD
jgi:membrane-bound lytic murein transglycosylase D